MGTIDQKSFIPVNTPLLNGNEKKYLNECIETGWISSEGPFVTKFESEFAKKVERKFGIAVANGSMALDLALTALNLKPGDEVIMPSFTIISCASAILRAGGQPVLVDSDPVTWNMDATSLETKITTKTKAIMIVHIYGLPADLDPILEIAKKYNLLIIEDAAEMHGQTYNGLPCGSFGDISIFSFYPNKLITTGEGGMAVTNDQKIADRCRSLRNLCFENKKRFVHEELGWNMRMTNLQAALGLAQLEQMDEFVIKKRAMGERYLNNLSDVVQFDLPCRATHFAQNIFWVFGLVLKKNISVNAAQVIEMLADKGVGTRPFFWPMHEQPIFKKMGLFSEVSLPIAENLARRGFYLPSGLALTLDEVDEVCSRLKKLIPNKIR